MEPLPLPPEAMAAARRGGPGDPAAQGRVDLELPVEAAFELEAAVCSHGLFMMAPNRWDAASGTLLRPLRLASSPSASLLARVSCHPSHPSRLLVSVLGASTLSPRDHLAILEQVRRMLRVSPEEGRAVAEFQATHAAAREAGFGRVFRSPTLFEDMVKCMLLCNCQWARSLSMASALCELQRELKSSTSSEAFQSKTPPIREYKRKRSKNQNVRVKLETKFEEDKLECLEDPKQATNNSDDVILSSLSSVTSETGSECDTSGSSELGLNDAFRSEDCIGDFPIPEELATLDENFLAERCKLGYRAQRIVMLARSIVEGKVCLKKLEEICRESVPCTYEKLDAELSTIPGFGPFTRANVLMCMGFFHKIPADTETVRHLKKFHKRVCTISSIQKDLHAIYGKYAPFQFLAYWFELWGFYDKQFGKISEMAPSDYRLFTASNLNKSTRKMNLKE